MNSDEYQYLQNKNWRALGYNWDILSTYDNTARLYCLTDFQAAWLLSNTEYMRWSTRWTNCPCTQSDLDAMKAEMDYNLMNCLDFSPYQMDYIYDALQRQENNRLNDLWDGSDPTSINPNAPDTNFDGDGSTDREDALCTGLSLWTYSYAINWINRASALLTAAAVTAALVDFIVPVGGQIVSQAIKDLAAPVQEQVDALNNTDALDTVICDWRESLEGVAISASNWNDEICALSYTIDTDEWYIQELLCSDTALLSNFLSFVDALGNGYELAQIGVEICPCEENVWTQRWLNGYGNPLTDGWTTGLGTYNVSTEELDYEWNGSSSNSINITYTFTESAHITRLRLQGRSKSPGSSRPTWVRVYDDDDNLIAESMATIPAGSSFEPVDNQATDLDVDVDVDWYLNYVIASSYPSGEAYATDMLVEGTGENPFD